MKILVTGSGGHLGQEIVRTLSPRHAVVAFPRRELDVSDAAAVAGALERSGAEVLVNCAAFTDVDAAEDEPVQALLVNALAVRGLASAARRAGAALVHYGTDFVFDGLASRPYEETDAPNPLSTYACSKLIGEWFARDVPRHYVLRVETLFGSATGNGRRTTVDRIVDSILEGAEVRVFSDRVTTPSYTVDVARATEALLAANAAPGLYHCVNSGLSSFPELALEAGRQLGRTPRLSMIAMKDAGLRARRPVYCALSNERLRAAGVAMPRWQDALGRYLRERGAAR